MLAPGLLALVAQGVAQPPNPVVLDLAAIGTGESLRRVLGSIGGGSFGVPVAGGTDLDGDQLADYAMAAMVASPLGRVRAGAVFLIFGDGTTAGTLDTATVQPGILRIAGTHSDEHTGSEIWMADVTGDGLGDLLICRQDHSPSGRLGAGALTILAGSPAVRTFAATGQWLDLAVVPTSLRATTIVGAGAGDRLGIWVRTGDVDGDGTNDLVVGADRRDLGQTDNGTAYVIRGGTHLAAGGTIDLADVASPAFALAGEVAEIVPPVLSNEFHFGATVQIADLDGNGRGEVLVAATLNRAGASLGPPGMGGNGGGGAPRGRLYIAWDGLFPSGAWPSPFSFMIDADSSLRTEIRGAVVGGAVNDRFGEEIVGGLDYDRDFAPDLYVGDITGSAPSRALSGLGYVFFAAAQLRGLSFDLATVPAAVTMTTIYGPAPGAIGGDTAADGDFDGDDLADLMVSSPHSSPLGRDDAGTMHILYGRAGGWPALIDLAPGSLPPSNQIEIAEVYGANGTNGNDAGDTLSYSAAVGDVDGDGRVDLITNEMLGNGSITDDVGNLIVFSGALLDRGVVIFSESFETGGTSRWSAVRETGG